jgi:hypothetical protein
MPSRTIQGCGLGVVFQQPARARPSVQLFSGMLSVLAADTIEVSDLGSTAVTESDSTGVETVISRSRLVVLRR